MMHNRRPGCKPPDSISSGCYQSSTMMFLYFPTACSFSIAPLTVSPLLYTSRALLWGTGESVGWDEEEEGQIWFKAGPKASRVNKISAYRLWSSFQPELLGSRIGSQDFKYFACKAHCHHTEIIKVLSATNHSTKAMGLHETRSVRI